MKNKIYSYYYLIIFLSFSEASMNCRIIIWNVPKQQCEWKNPYGTLTSNPTTFSTPSECPDCARSANDTHPVYVRIILMVWYNPRLSGRMLSRGAPRLNPSETATVVDRWWGPSSKNQWNRGWMEVQDGSRRVRSAIRRQETAISQSRGFSSG